MKYLQGKYILDADGNPKSVTDVMEWTDWIENSENTKIAFDWFEEPAQLWISTTFTGTDHNFFNQGQPLLFETRVSDDDGPWENLYKEYSTKDEALAGHAETMKYLMGKEESLVTQVEELNHIPTTIAEPESDDTTFLEISSFTEKSVQRLGSTPDDPPGNYDLLRRSLLRQVFEKLQLIGVDLTDKQSVADFIANLQQRNPTVAQQFEKDMDVLLTDSEPPLPSKDVNEVLTLQDKITQDQPYFKDETSNELYKQEQTHRNSESNVRSEEPGLKTAWLNGKDDVIPDIQSSQPGEPASSHMWWITLLLFLVITFIFRFQIHNFLSSNSDQLTMVFIFLLIGCGIIVQIIRYNTPERRAERERNLAEGARIRAEQQEAHRQRKNAEYVQRQEVRRMIENMPEYSAWRQHILDRDYRRCVINDPNCDQIKLEVDHIQSFDSIIRAYNLTSEDEARSCAILWDPKNGRTLCKPHHDMTETSRYRAAKS